MLLTSFFVQFATSSFSVTSMLRAPGTRPYYPNSGPPLEGLFFNHPRFLTPPPMAWFDEMALRRIFDSLLRAIRTHDVSTLQTVLRSASSNSDSRASREHPELSSFLEAPLLVNLRDSTGLTLVHHAVSQRPYPNIAMLDALYSAGSDVGLFSTLGFSPLHHLARTAKDDAQPAEKEQMLSHSSISTRTHPLYTFTRHLVRDLCASLRATDSKGETPLHAAAEHGRSVSVLLAMLDCDRESSGTMAVKELRNERG
jgi:Ankyrin repeat